MHAKEDGPARERSAIFKPNPAHWASPTSVRYFTQRPNCGFAVHATYDTPHIWAATRQATCISASRISIERRRQSLAAASSANQAPAHARVLKHFECTFWTPSLNLSAFDRAIEFVDACSNKVNLRLHFFISVPSLWSNKHTIPSEMSFLSTSSLHTTDAGRFFVFSAAFETA